MANVFEKWNNSVDIAGLQKDVKDAEQNGGSGNYEEVPVGNYEVKVEKMELKESKKGDPMFFCQFRILAGDFENKCLFMNQVITQGFQIHIVNSFLKSLGTGVEVKFENYAQYNDVIMDVAEAIDEAGLEYLLEYKKSKKDFAVYTVKEIYE